jgi:hypothetical protein
MLFAVVVVGFFTSLANFAILVHVTRFSCILIE